MGYRVAVAGATGAVGQEILKTLSERNFPASDVIPLASAASAGREVSYGEDDTLKVQDLSKFDFKGTDIGLFSPGAKVSSEFAPKAAAAGTVVIDNTSFFRMDPDIPLIVPEVNRGALGTYGNRNIIANPNCSTIQLVVALKPLHEISPIKRVVVSTYQATSGAGKDGMDELFNQTRSRYVNEVLQPDTFSRQIAFNVIPQIDVFMEDGSTKEEWKMVVETKKILDPSIKVSATCVRVPVFVGHSVSANVEFHNPIDITDARQALASAPGVLLTEQGKEGEFVTPQEVAGEDGVYVSRLRDDPSVENGLAMWIVSDNLRKGAALNTVQIAESLVADYLSKS
ncbi:MAG: aspartate-semialdehyde dehydrogenase [Pseudomonadota bacterium]